jgi:hypothetical protein
METRQIEGRRLPNGFWAALTLFLLFGLSSSNVFATVHDSLLKQSSTTIAAPPILLQSGSVGNSTIYTNNTSAKVSVGTPLSTHDFVDNNASDVDGNANKGTNSNFSAQQHGPDSIYDTLTEVDTNSSSLEKYSYCNNNQNPGTWTNPTYAYDNNTGQAATKAWSTVGASGYLVLNTTLATRGSRIRYWVDRSQSSITTLEIGVGNQTGSWTTVFNGTPTWSAYANASITFCQYTAIRIQFYKTGSVSRTASIYEVQGVVDAVLANYWLDVEVQWTNADYDEANEELAISVYKENNTHSLDATGGYMKVGDGTPDWGSTAGTISFWITWDTLQGGAIQTRPWGQHYDMETRMVYSYENGTHTFNKLFVNWGSVGSIISNADFTTGKWYFIAIAWNENTDDLYLYVGDKNTVPAQDAQVSGWTDSVSTVGVIENNFLSSQGGSDPTDGHGDDLRYWNVARSLMEIQSDYNTELIGSKTNLRSYFKLNNNFDDIGPNDNDGSGVGSYSFSSDVPFGAPPTENIRVDVWNGTAWQNLFTNLTNGWNNVSVSSCLNSSNFTIRFKGNTETGDTTQDRWKIDSTLLHVWTEGPYDYVLKVVNNVADAWNVSLRVYTSANVSRLSNLTISFHDGSSSDQIIVNNGNITQSEGALYDLLGNATVYIKISNLQSSTAGTSCLYAYLKILVPNTTNYLLYIIAFEIT